MKKLILTAFVVMVSSQSFASGQPAEDIQLGSRVDRLERLIKAIAPKTMQSCKIGDFDALGVTNNDAINDIRQQCARVKASCDVTRVQPKCVTVNTMDLVQ